MVDAASDEQVDIANLEFRRALNSKPLVPSLQLTPPPALTATLELVSEKENAHSDVIRSVAFSPNGKTIVSGSNDKTLRVWSERLQNRTSP